MAKQIIEYKAKYMALDNSSCIDCDKECSKNGVEGILQIYESEHLHPGEKYVVFESHDKIVYLKTSCGKIDVSKDVLTIYTRNNNTYTFSLTEKVQTIEVKFVVPERYRHICCSCNKSMVLSSKEAFELGWDYPGKDGIYKDMPNHGFGILAPRTCGDCGITQSLYWRTMVGEKLSKKDYETLERIQNEPMSLL